MKICPETYKNKEWLYDKYIVEKLNSRQIGEICGVHKNTICKYLKKFNIPIRSLSYAIYLTKRKDDVIVSDFAKEVIIGNLLGDGCLSLQTHNTKTIRTVSYNQSCKYIEFLEHVEKIMVSTGFETAGNIYKCVHPKQKNVFYSYFTKRYKELLEIRKIFYKDKKVIPESLKLSPTVCMYWYLGDGRINKKSIELATCCFTEKENKVLIKKFKEININVSIINNKGYHLLFMNNKNSREFLNYIGDCPKDLKNTYGYKFFN